jgi:membrane-associated protease RseP (regulator of RpoE activity)
MFTKTEKKKIAVEFAGVLLLFALGIATFFLLAMMYETPVPSSLYSSQTRGEVMSK